MKREKKPDGAKVSGASHGLGDSSEIAKRLKDYYNDLVSEDVPRRFVDLLNQLERADSERRRAPRKDQQDEHPKDPA